MPSSTSSSEVPGFRRQQTASDRPGVAQPVPERVIPQRPWGRVWWQALLLFALLLAGWEGYWRSYGVTPAYANSDGSWATQRRRIDQGEGDKAVLIGSSRTLFDMQLDVWQQVTGERPIQLALEGTSAVPVLEDLADDPKFTGRLFVGVTPGLFFTGFAYRAMAIKHFHKEGPSQRVRQWLSQQLVEPYFAFYDHDYALETVVSRQAWPVRPGTHPMEAVRKLSVSQADRNTHMWAKVENDAAYQAMARRIWSQFFNGPPPPPLSTPEKAKAVVARQIERAAIAIGKLRARGVRVVLVRLPSSGDYYAFEQMTTPRAFTWEPLLKATGAPGIHFEDYPQMQGCWIPEWSHVAAGDAKKLTAAVAPLVTKAWASMPSQ